MPYKEINDRRKQWERWIAGHPGYAKDRAAKCRAERRELADSLKNACISCGYSRCKQALDFHHRDGADKDTEVSKLVKAMASVKRIMAEIAKCDVVCANCHRERHCKR